jgi:hypothetical protein
MVKNIKEAKELVERYKAITPEIIDRVNKETGNRSFIAPNIMNELTGFASFTKCILCKATRTDQLFDCIACIYNQDNDIGFTTPYCLKQLTYHAIDRAQNTEDLMLAIHQRIIFIQSLIDHYEKAEEV